MRKKDSKECGEGRDEEDLRRGELKDGEVGWDEGRRFKGMWRRDEEGKTKRR